MKVIFIETPAFARSVLGEISARENALLMGKTLSISLEDRGVSLVVNKVNPHQINIRAALKSPSFYPEHLEDGAVLGSIDTLMPSRSKELDRWGLSTSSMEEKIDLLIRAAIDSPALA